MKSKLFNYQYFIDMKENTVEALTHDIKQKHIFNNVCKNYSNTTFCKIYYYSFNICS